MRTHSNDFKNGIKQYGRQFTDNIYYGNNTYNGEHINSVNYSVDTTLLKSVMQTIKIDTDILLEVNNTLDYGISLSGTNDEIKFNNFIVNKVEEQIDKKSYLVTCYDNMIKTMVDYETPKVNGTTITFPITIREYIDAICNHLGLTFKNASSTFTNYNVSIPKDYYLDEGGNNLGYTFRDVLDDIAECIGGWLCCDSNGQIEVRNITTTNDTINEDYFKDRNVNVGKKYGPINSVVFSRIGEDNIYRKDDESIEEDGLCEVKITDNQLLSDENRDNFIQGVYDNLHGLEFYLNDFQLTGVLYYEVGDMFNASIDNNLYQCLLLSDSFKRTTGLSETIITTEPKITETDYKKADTNDRKINQTTLIVDKQNQTISSVVSNVSEQNTKISTINQKVDELTSQISDIADITTSGESSYATFDLDRINESEPIMIKARPITTNISYLYPSDNLYPSDTLFMPIRTIRFHNKTTDEDFDYELPDDLLYYDSEHYDEFYLDYESQTCEIIKKCKYNADGSVGLLSQEQTISYTYPEIDLTEGDYTISLLGYTNGYLFTRLMSQNIYTAQFYTKAETNSLINQTASSIDLSVDNKLSNYSTTTQMNSAISITANEINSVVSQKVGNDEVISKINQTPEAVTINTSKLNLQGYITATNLSTSGETTINGDNITTGTIKSSNYVSGTSGSKYDLVNGKMEINSNDNNGSLIINSTVQNNKYTDLTGRFLRLWNETTGKAQIQLDNSTNMGIIRVSDSTGTDISTMNGYYVESAEFRNISLEELKKNIEPFEKGLDIIKKTDIYKYNYKNEDDKTKKHIGIVIGKNYNYSKELTSKDNKGVNLYSMIAVCFKAIQEQQEEIEKLKEEIKNAKN